MAANSEIEKLERRWLDNPLGLTFASLAEAYRKGGDPARALEVLAAGLTQHPNYVPAHIVRGRCHFDAHADAGAEAAFLRVLELDRENVIALKGLAEVSERGGRLGEAIQRLESLVDVDPNNEEARGQLDRLRELLAAPAEPVAPVAPAAPVIAPEESPPGEAASTGDSAEGDRHEGTEFQLVSDAETLSASSERMADILLASDAPILESGLGPVDGLLGGDYASLVAFQHPAERFEEAVPAPAEREPEHEPAADEPELVVTETMAEIFLRQGHRELALAVYQQLAQREPSNERIVEAVARLTPAVPEPEPEPESEPVAVREYGAAATGGTSVGALLDALFKAQRPPVVATVHPPAFESAARDLGEPSRPAGEALSLSAVFGDEASPTGPASPEPKAVDNEPSFDEFFAPATGASAEAELPSPPTEAGASPAQVPEDLEQFNAWLRGLKR